MTTKRRDRQLGAGYDYQWDVATFLLLALLLPRDRASLQPELRDSFRWLGAIARVHLEGRESDKALEDVNLFATNGRSLRIQVKETNEDQTKHIWRQQTPSFVEFLNRIGHDPIVPERHDIFLSNGTFHKDVRDLLASRDRLTSFYDEVIVAQVKAAKRAPREQFVTNAGRVKVCTFLAATPLSDGDVIDGVGRASVNELIKLGVLEPEDAYDRLHRRVMKWSFRAGGTSLTLPELRNAVLDLLGVSFTAAGGRGVNSMVDYLKNIPDDSQNWPSWSDLDMGRVWFQDPALNLAEENLHRAHLAFLVGGQGSGKTVVARTLGYRFHNRGYAPVYWDFEHLGNFPRQAAEFWHDAIVHAQVLGCRPLVVLENVHLNVDAFRTLLGMREVKRDWSDAPIPLIATSRVATLGNHEPLQRLCDIKVSLDEEQPKRGRAFLAWWFEEILHLDANAHHEIMTVIPWTRYLHNFWALRLALDALDPETRSLRMWAVEDMLRNRLEKTIKAHDGADDLLYLVSGLGRNGIATDFAAAARALGQPLATIHSLAEQAHRDGLLSINTANRSCRFWHDSLADRYWTVFAMERDRWARTARQRFGAGAA